MVFTSCSLLPVSCSFSIRLISAGLLVFSLLAGAARGQAPPASREVQEQAVRIDADLKAGATSGTASGEDQEHPVRLDADLTAGVTSGTSSAGPEASASPKEPAPVTLQDLVRKVLDRNPAIKSAARQVQSLRARVPQVKTLPDPVVTAGWMGNIVPFSVQRGDPSSYRGINVMEEIPFPGKLKLRGQIADREAETTWWDYENTRREVVAQVKVAYYNYFSAHKAIEITQKDRDLLDKLARIAEVRYQVGTGIQQDVLKAQVEQSRLLQRLTVFEQEEKTAQVRLNTLLNQDPETPLPPPATFEQAKFPYTLDEIYELVHQNDPGLKREERMIERSQLAVNLARKDYSPDFRIGYTYEQRPLLPDMHGFTVGVSIPIFYKTKQREGVIEATEEMIGARRRLEDRHTTHSFEVKRLYLAAKASEELARLYSRAVVPQSSLALDSSMASYEVGKLDLLSVLTNFQTILDYEINYYQELSNYQMALAQLEVMVGRELTQ